MGYYQKARKLGLPPSTPISLETSAFFSEVAPAMISNWQTTGYSILSGDPMPFGVSVSYEGSQTSAFANYQGSSGTLAHAATGFTGAAISGSIQGYQLANGIWSPLNLTMPGLSILNVYSDLIDANGAVIDRVASVADRIPESIQFSATSTVDPTGKHPPKK
jgi:hypothetical protein